MPKFPNNRSFRRNPLDCFFFTHSTRSAKVGLHPTNFWAWVVLLTVALSAESFAQERHTISTSDDVVTHFSSTIARFPADGLSWTCYSKGAGPTPSVQNLPTSDGWSHWRLYVGLLKTSSSSKDWCWGILEFGNVTPSPVRIVWDFINDKSTDAVKTWLKDLIFEGKDNFKASPFRKREDNTSYPFENNFFDELFKLGEAVGNGNTGNDVGFLAEGTDGSQRFAVVRMDKGNPIDGVTCTSPQVESFNAEIIEMGRSEIAGEKQWKGTIPKFPEKVPQLFAIGKRGMVTKDGQFTVSFQNGKVQTKGGGPDAGSKFAAFWPVEELSEINQADLVAMSVFSPESWRGWNDRDDVPSERKIGSDKTQPIPIDPALWAIPKEELPTPSNPVSP